MCSRFLIIERLFESPSQFVSQLHTGICKEAMQPCSISILVGYAWKHLASLKSSTAENKAALVAKSLKESNDAEIVQLLFLLYGMEDADFFKILRVSHSKIGGVENVTAEVVHELLDMREARSTFLGLGSDDLSCFSTLHKIETLKILIGMCPSFNTCNVLRRNYLHFAVQNGNKEWVEHLLESGCQVDERDKLGDTPILCISSERPLEMTRILIQHGADVYSKNKQNENIAHALFRQSRSIQYADLSLWVSFIQQQGHVRLWSMPDDLGRTPLAVLSEEIGTDHPVTFELLSMIENIK